MKVPLPDFFFLLFFLLLPNLPIKNTEASGIFGIINIYQPCQQYLYPIIIIIIMGNLRCNCGTVLQLYLTVRCQWTLPIQLHPTTRYNCGMVPQLHRNLILLLLLFHSFITLLPLEITTFSFSPMCVM